MGAEPPHQIMFVDRRIQRPRELKYDNLLCHRLADGLTGVGMVVRTIQTHALEVAEQMKPTEVILDDWYAGDPKLIADLRTTNPDVKIVVNGALNLDYRMAQEMIEAGVDHLVDPGLSRHIRNFGYGDLSIFG